MDEERAWANKAKEAISSRGNDHVTHGVSRMVGALIFNFNFLPLNSEVEGSNLSQDNSSSPSSASLSGIKSQTPSVRKL